MKLLEESQLGDVGWLIEVNVMFESVPSALKGAIERNSAQHDRCR